MRDQATADAMKALQMIEDAVAKSAGGYDELRDKADQLFEDRVAQIAKANKCTMSKAHYLATTDEVATRAYELSAELAEKQALAFEAGGQIAAFIE